MPTYRLVMVSYVYVNGVSTKFSDPMDLITDAHNSASATKYFREWIKTNVAADAFHPGHMTGEVTAERIG